MPRPLPIYSQSDYLIQVVDIKSHSKLQTVQIQTSWLLQLIWICTVCKGSVYLGSAGHWLRIIVIIAPSLVLQMVLLHTITDGVTTCDEEEEEQEEKDGNLRQQRTLVLIELMMLVIAILLLMLSMLCLC